jgi:hypothetical protein
MAASDVDMQAVSITPQTFLYDQDASLNATLARIQNEQIAKLTKQLPDRFLGGIQKTRASARRTPGAPFACFQRYKNGSGRAGGRSHS